MEKWYYVKYWCIHSGQWLYLTALHQMCGPSPNVKYARKYYLADALNTVKYLLTAPYEGNPSVTVELVD
jgi:hypothetical protein